MTHTVHSLTAILRDNDASELVALGPVGIKERFGLSTGTSYEVHRKAQWKVMGIDDAEPPTNHKTAVLTALYHNGKADLIQDLLDWVLAEGFVMDMHNLVHVVWTLQKQQLVKFYEHKRRGQPTHGNSIAGIKLTPQGVSAAEALKSRAEVVSVAQAIQNKAQATLGDQMVALMRERPWPTHAWKAADIAKEWGVEQDERRVQIIRVALNRDSRFVRPGNEAGVWALREQVEARRESERLRQIEEQRRKAEAAAAKAPKVEPVVEPTPEPVKTEPIRQNEKAEKAPTFTAAIAQFESDVLGGLDLIDAVWAKFQRREKMLAAAAILEASGEDELAITVLSRVELSPMEQEVATLVGRIKGVVPVGQTVNASSEVPAGK